MYSRGFVKNQTQFDEIQELLAQYLGQERSLREFDEAYVALTWNDSAANDKRTADLRGAIYLLLAEYTAGHRTEEELQQELQGLAADPILIRPGKQKSAA